MKTEDMTVGDVLRAGAKKVRQGWCQGTSDDLRGNVCAVGALWYSSDDLVTYADAVQAVADALGIHSVAGWNDKFGRTQEEVVQALLRAADYWESQQTPAIVWTMREDVTA